MIEPFSWGIPCYSSSCCLISIILGRFHFLMEWCIERFVVKTVSVVKVGAIKGYANSNQSLSLCNHGATNFLPKFTISLWYPSIFDSVKVVLRWKNEKSYLKVFYNFFSSSLLKLLEKVKPTKRFFYFWVWHLFLEQAISRKAKRASMSQRTRAKGFKSKFSQNVPNIDAYILNQNF